MEKLTINGDFPQIFLQVLQSMQRGDDWQCNRVLSGAAQTLLERRSHGLLRCGCSEQRCHWRSSMITLW